ncbi:type II toxin-antitoxin system RelE/ParE family toxin [Nonomuraea purpurea]|uniref:Type II toxin-antitoxin system RelE/ParE family toxin n=1 Tax=Nonomuraea purpurea TaxID=1849276 RepID=A0ABV8G112_9ACTN
MYVVDFDPPAEKQRDALPTEALAALMELRAVLEMTPWSGTPPSNNPAGNMLTMPFGDFGLVTYFVMEERRLVYIVRITWV